MQWYREAQVKPALLRKKANELLWKICSGQYYETLPIREISDALKSIGIEMEKDFILTGHDGRGDFDLTFNGQPMKDVLHMQWHRMEHSGRFEVNAYIL
jgi:hypothetical protein